MKSIVRLTVLCAALAAPAPLLAQAPAPAPAPPPAPLVVANPTYEAFTLEITVNRPARDVWAKVGKFCDIEKWLGSKCVMTAGKDGQLGAVRTLNGVTIEPIVAMTDLSYAYTQPVRQGVPPNLYHGALEARPLSPTTTKLIYSFFYDTSMLDAAGAAATKATRTQRFTAALQKMKEIAEAN